MDLPVNPPLSPMLAKSAKGIPDPAKYEDGLLFEPKWDGFRCIIFRDGDEVELGSRNERPLTRYFPEVVEAVKQSLPARCVVDGEIVVASDGRLQFEVLQERIHPADSRVQKLSVETPASYVAFDLLAIDDESLMETPLGDAAYPARAGAVRTPPRRSTSPRRPRTSRRRGVVRQLRGRRTGWHRRQAADGAYQPNGRAMIKVKHERTCDAVVAGYRLHKTVDRGEAAARFAPPRVVRRRGPAAAHRGVGRVPEARRAELIDELEPLLVDPKRPPVAAVGRSRGAREGPAAGRGLTLERQEGPVLDPDRPGARGRGRLRPHGGHPVAAHGAVQALADGPDTRVVHLRSARGGRRLRPGRDPP